MTINNQNAKMTLSCYGKTTTVEFDHSDVGLDEYFHAFKTLLVGATFSEKQFENFMIDEAETYAEMSHENKNNLFP
jgi:hypothetical protein